MREKILSAAMINIKNKYPEYNDDKLEEIKADSVVLALGFRASNPLKEENVHVIGDAKQAKTIMNAIWEGYELSNTL